jgi:WD40 repeat protein
MKNPDKSTTAFDEDYASWLAAWDDVLAGRRPANFPAKEVPAELRPRLERDLAWLSLLRQRLPIHPEAAPVRTEGGNKYTKPTPNSSDTDQEAVPARLGRFEIRRELGHGSFGRVFLAYDLILRREVALKVPRLEILPHPELRERFQREARAAARLDHPNLVPVYEGGEIGPVCYIASAYCPGVTLAAWLRGRSEPVPAELAARFMVPLADVVAHAHSRGVLHRDLKPSNVLLEPAVALRPDGLDFVPRITDFGLAKLSAEETQNLTQSGVVLGTPSYMAPEQASGGKSKEIGPATDVYALGAILYELLTGRPPFLAESMLDMLEQVRSREPVPPRRLRPRLPRDLETICLKCLQKEPSKRYANAQELADDLGRFLKHEPIKARPTPAWEQGIKWMKRRPTQAALVGVSTLALLSLLGEGLGFTLVVVLVTATGFVGVTWQWQRAERARREAADKAERLESNLYVHQISLAEREWVANNLGRAEELLDQCPEHLRCWEWRFLKRLHRSDCIVLQGRHSLIMCVTFSPDGRRLAAAGGDTIHLWDVQEGREIGAFRGHDKQVREVVFSPGGSRLASVGEDGQGIIWDLASGQELLRLRGHDGPVLGVSFSQDGRWLATAGWDRTIKLWDASSGRELQTLRGHSRAAWTVAFSPDGRRLASSGEDVTLLIWDLASRPEETCSAPRELRGHNVGVSHIAFSPDGRRLVSASPDCSIKLWDLTTCQEVLTFGGHTLNPWAVAFSPDGRRIASAGLDKLIRVWDPATGQELLGLRGHSDNVFSLAFSPEGYRLASAGGDGTVRIWDATPFAEKTQPTPRTLHVRGNWVRGLAFAPDGRRIALASYREDCTTQIWDARTGEPIRTLAGHSNVINYLAFHPDGRRVATAGADGTIKIWDIDTGQALLTLENSHVNLAVVCSPDAIHVAGAAHDGRLRRGTSVAWVTP